MDWTHSIFTEYETGEREEPNEEIEEDLNEIN